MTMELKTRPCVRKAVDKYNEKLWSPLSVLRTIETLRGQLIKLNGRGLLDEDELDDWNELLTQLEGVAHGTNN